MTNLTVNQLFHHIELCTLCRQCKIRGKKKGETIIPEIARADRT